MEFRRFSFGLGDIIACWKVFCTWLFRFRMGKIFGLLRFVRRVHFCFCVYSLELMASFWVLLLLVCWLIGAMMRIPLFYLFYFLCNRCSFFFFCSGRNRFSEWDYHVHFALTPDLSILNCQSTTVNIFICIFLIPPDPPSHRRHHNATSQLSFLRLPCHHRRQRQDDPQCALHPASITK